HALSASRLDRYAYAHFRAVGFLFADELVLVDLPLRKLRLAQRYRSGLGCKTEALAIEVVAVGYSIADFHGPRVDSAGGKAECLVRLEQIVGARRTRRRQRSEQQQQDERKSVHELSRPRFRIDPIEVRGQSPRQSDRDDLRKFVGMTRADRRFELGVAAASGLDEHREVLGVLGLALPAIDRAARRQDIDARSEALFHELVRELRRAAAVGQIGDDEIRLRGLHAASLIRGMPSRTVE